MLHGYDDYKAGQRQYPLNKLLIGLLHLDLNCNSFLWAHSHQCKEKLGNKIRMFRHGLRLEKP